MVTFYSFDGQIPSASPESNHACLIQGRIEPIAPLEKSSFDQPANTSSIFVQFSHLCYVHLWLDLSSFYHPNALL